MQLFLNIVTNGFSAMLGLVVLAVGIWFLVQPKVVVSPIPIVIGLVLIFHSIGSIIEAVDAKNTVTEAGVSARFFQ